MADSISPPAGIGFVGLGNMGSPMAHLLVHAGYRLHPYDANAGTLQQFSQDNDCEAASDLETLGASSDVVITMLPEGSIVREVLLGDNGVVAGLQPGSILIDMSSSSPIGTRELSAELKQKEIPLVDAPVSGGVKKATEGTLAIMTGGETEVINRVQALLEVMGKVFHVGESGSGHAMKALNNYLSAGTLAMTAEAVLAGMEFGLDPARMVDILNASTGRSTASEHKFPAFVLSRTFDSGFALGLMAKDLRLAVEIARVCGTPAKLLNDLSGIYDQAEHELGFSADNTDVVRYLETQIGNKKND